MNTSLKLYAHSATDLALKTAYVLRLSLTQHELEMPQDHGFGAALSVILHTGRV